MHVIVQEKLKLGKINFDGINLKLLLTIQSQPKVYIRRGGGGIKKI